MIDAKIIEKLRSRIDKKDDEIFDLNETIRKQKKRIDALKRKLNRQQEKEEPKGIKPRMRRF